ncbi:MAG: M20/M25/M40 family metallo-hydrolase, partial [Candidatus Acidiferrum sp.]
MPIRSSVVHSLPRPFRANSLADQPQVREALNWLDRNLDWTTAQQIRITEIPAPSFQEDKRAQAVKEILSTEGLSVFTDKIGNVIGELRGSQDKEVVMLAAHLDTVFPPGTEIKVRREGDRLLAPGISDNGTGLAALLAVARAIQVAKIKPQRTVLFAANVGEEGEGNLRGMRALVDAYRSKLRAVIVLDGSGIDHVTVKALASRRVEVLIT